MSSQVLSAINTLVDTLSLSDVKKLSKNVNRILSYTSRKSSISELKEIIEFRGHQGLIQCYFNFVYINYGWECYGTLIVSIYNHKYQYHRCFGHNTKQKAKELVAKNFVAILNYYNYFDPQTYDNTYEQYIPARSKGPTHMIKQQPDDGNDNKNKSKLNRNASEYIPSNEKIYHSCKIHKNPWHDDDYWNSLSDNDKHRYLDAELDTYQAARGKPISPDKRRK